MTFKKLDNNKIFFANNVGGVHKINYALYKDNGKEFDPVNLPPSPKNFENRQGRACYGGIMTIDTEAYNRLYTILDLNRWYSSTPTIGPEKKKEWIKIAREHGLLPDYVSEDSVSEDGTTGKCIFKLEDLNKSLLYVYLCVFRYLQEGQELIKTILYLHKDIGMNFWAAFFLASVGSFTDTNHHISRYAKTVYTGNIGTTPKSIYEEINIRPMIGLQRYIKNPNKYDKRPLTDTTHWNCGNIIDSTVFKENFMVPIKDLFKNDVLAMIESKNDGEFRKYKRRYKSGVTK